MGKSSVKTPTYDINQAQNEQVWAAEQNRKYGNVGVNSALGGYNWITNNDGTQSVNVNLNNADNQRLKLEEQALNNLNLDPSNAQDTYYNMSLRYMQPEMEQQQADLESNLIRKGIPIGSQAWNSAIGELQDNQQQALAQARDNALFQGQNYLSNQIGNINSIGSNIYNPLQSMVQGTGGEFGNNYNNAYNAQMQKAQMEQQNRNALYGMIGSVLGGVTGGLTGKIL